MKLAVAQTRPMIGPVEGNLAQHESMIHAAAHNGVELLVFPELSLTGYEPTQAAELSRRYSDSCFNVLQSLCDDKELSVAVGVPLAGRNLPTISLVVFRPGISPMVYSKQYLHPDELPFFEAGAAHVGIVQKDHKKVALAICYEISVPQHAEQAFSAGASVYLASVAKTAKGIQAAHERLADIARHYSMLVLMSNCVGHMDGGLCAGGTAVWNRNGQRIAQLDTTSAGMLIMDSDTEEVIAVRAD